MSEISVGVSDDVAILVEQLDPDEIQRIVGSARRERASEERMDDFADEQLAMSELDDDTTRVLAAVVQERALARHRSEPVT